MAPDEIRKKISKSAFYRLKEKVKTILAETDEKTTKNKYIRKAETDLEPFEEHLKIKICEKTESTGSFKWTYALLKALALNERTKEPFYQKPNEEEAVKQVCEIFKNISTDFIKSWRMTGFKKFAHF